MDCEKLIEVVIDSTKPQRNNLENTERHVDFINTNIFFKEFTYGSDMFVKDGNNQQIELADNIVCLDDIYIIYQIKEKELVKDDDNFLKWFNNKVLKKAVKQIKSTVKIVSGCKEIILKNNRGHKKKMQNISSEALRKVIIYNPKGEVSEECRFQKFYESKEVGLIHLFHIEDYHWICQFLITPCEVYDYLLFREEIYEAQKNDIKEVPEQYVLGHFFSNKDVNHLDPSYIENLFNLNDDINSFDLGPFLSLLGDKVKLLEDNKEDDYYTIFCEIAKLHRNELREFKKRFLKIIQLSKKDEYCDPFRITFPRTGCGFVFVVLTKELSIHWKAAVTSMAMAHIYEQQIDKCVGLVVYEDEEYQQIFWIYAEGKWRYDKEMEEEIKTFPLREIKIKDFDGYDLGSK